ncbi:MAG TPA: hypothetical protein VLY63_25110, partial [Anaerolineae bacterium]|nr:hypothetical protein [Anaerolineae bacterium]
HEAPEADLEDLWPSDARSLLRLVVLSTSHATVSLATRLARRLGAAVVASQGPMPVADLLPFAHKFYMHLFEHGLVDRAINEARLAIFEKDRPYWTFPVLLMGLPHGQLFHPPSPGEENES